VRGTRETGIKSRRYEGWQSLPQEKKGKTPVKKKGQNGKTEKRLNTIQRGARLCSSKKVRSEEKGRLIEVGSLKRWKPVTPSRAGVGASAGTFARRGNNRAKSHSY